MLKKYYINMSREKKDDMITEKKDDMITEKKIIATRPSNGRIPVE